jgi:hypothetical protein
VLVGKQTPASSDVNVEAPSGHGDRDFGRDFHGHTGCVD